jgi:hypothetical protein
MRERGERKRVRRDAVGSESIRVSSFLFKRGKVFFYFIISANNRFTSASHSIHTKRERNNNVNMTGMDVTVVVDGIICK